MPFKHYTYSYLSNPFKRLILALVSGVIVFVLVCLAPRNEWKKKYEAGEKEHQSDFLSEVDHWNEIKKEVLDLISYTLGLWSITLQKIKRKF